VAVALEVFDAAVAGSPDYEAPAAEFAGSLAGWICWGPTPCTVGTWDLYWMAVDPGLQGSGVGTALLEEMESRLRGRARLVVVETAGRPATAVVRLPGRTTPFSFEIGPYEIRTFRVAPGGEAAPVETDLLERPLAGP